MVPSTFKAVINNLTVFVKVTECLTWFYHKICTLSPKYGKEVLKFDASCNSVELLPFHFSSGISNHCCRQLLDCCSCKTTVNEDRTHEPTVCDHIVIVKGLVNISYIVCHVDRSVFGVVIGW